MAAAPTASCSRSRSSQTGSRPPPRRIADETLMRVAAIQFAPTFLDTARTLTRMLDRLAEAARGGAEVVVFPETALPGYPIWIGRTGGAAFEDPDQKLAYAAYLEAAVEEGGPELTRLAEAAHDLG